MVTDEFRKIAVSFAGGDGGNPKSEVWFCGLEWGIGDESSPDDFYEKFSLSPKLIPHSWVEDDFDGSWTTQYNRKICWFLWYYYNLDWKNGESAEHFVKKYDVLYPQGIGFKLNMLPINFKNRSSIKWNDQFIKMTGFETFNEYREWCVENRGAFYRQLIDECHPKVIICTGVTEKDNFFKFFTGEAVYETKALKGFNIFYRKYNNTLICVCPFFGGPSGINSYDKMEALVESVKELCK